MLGTCTATGPDGRLTHHLVRADSGNTEALRRIRREHPQPLPFVPYDPSQVPDEVMVKILKDGA